MTAAWTDVGYCSPLTSIAEATSEFDDESQIIRLRVPVRAAGMYLDGHYPGFPIFPGVFVIECVRLAVRAAVPHGRRLRLAKLEVARFTAPLLDGDELSLVLTVQRIDGEYLVSARGSRLDGIATAQVRARFVAEERKDA
jgi:3-hydroxyacyl-[acyl-carrier-protein] dehydratase